MTALIVLAVLAVPGALAAGLYGAARLADRSRRPSTVEQPENMSAAIPAPMLAPPEPISDEDRIHQEEQAALAAALAADREFFARLGRIVDRQFAGIETRARRAFTPRVWDEQAAWAELQSGEYALIGAAA